jgi:CheY-like chemotaxis protein
MLDKYIMLVEDNVDDIELTLRALSKANILNEVIVAQDGEEAIDFLLGSGKAIGKYKAELPVVILLDLKLPKIDGLEVLTRLRANEKTRYVPVVILTTSKEDQDLLNGYRLGANSYIRKPVDFQQFTEAIKQLGLYWLVLNEPPPRLKRRDQDDNSP